MIIDGLTIFRDWMQVPKSGVFRDFLNFLRRGKSGRRRLLPPFCPSKDYCAPIRGNSMQPSGNPMARVDFCRGRIEMESAILLVTVFAAGSLLAGSQEDRNPSKLLAAAREQSDIFNTAPRPFLLEADLTVQLEAPVHAGSLSHRVCEAGCPHCRQEREDAHQERSVADVHGSGSDRIEWTL